MVMSIEGRLLNISWHTDRSEGSYSRIRFGTGYPAEPAGNRSSYRSETGTDYQR
jgi:hypothetical protein